MLLINCANFKYKQVSILVDYHNVLIVIPPYQLPNNLLIPPVFKGVLCPRHPYPCLPIVLGVLRV